MVRLSVLVVILGAIGCGATVEPGTPGSQQGTGGKTSIPVGPPSGTGGASGPVVVGGTGGKTGTTPVVSGSGGAGSPSTPSTGTAYSDIPCAVATILKNNCNDCHGETPKFGAPMSLVRAADFLKRTMDGSQTVGEALIKRINDDARPMPPAPKDRLPASDRSTITSWIQGGAKPSACNSVGPGPGPGMGGPTAPDAPDPVGPGIKCYDIKARSTSGGKYSVPNTPDMYHCFSYAPPWGSQKVHLISWRPLIDNERVIHHWLLYNEASPVTDNTSSDCVGAHPNAQLVAGWAPGGGGNVLPDGVGQDVAGAGFTLETHYNNTGTAPEPDASGVHLCVTTELRKEEAGVHWLGTELILLPAGGQATGICTPKATTPVTILSSIPHMHLQGRHMTTTINRANGTKETLLDKPFDFNTQIGYATPAVIMPGDTLTTTCTYGGPATFGEGTKQEMCYNFVLAYPNGGLSSAISFLRKNGCTGF